MSEGNESEGNVSTTEPIQPPAVPKPENVAMSLQFHGSTIHVIDGPESRVFELDGTPYAMPGDAIAAARLKKVNAEKLNNGNDQTGNA
jgi:hypothetical protein